MNINNIAVALGLAGLGVVQQITSVQARTWNWSYSTTDSLIEAAGAFTTTNITDANGYYTITGITGTRNGINISSLIPTTQPVGGDPNSLTDNLISVNQPQLTFNGFGYLLENDETNTIYNPYFSSFASQYREYNSPDNGAVDPFPNDDDIPPDIIFQATPIPENSSFYSLAILPLFIGLSGIKKRITSSKRFTQ
ncbi:MAG TPA: hypothetical protein V6D15_10130 [Oculatellaceae cyanobacterium]|jgi:hypothetical protein